MGSGVRAAKWEFFVTRWGAMYDWVSGTVKAAQDGAVAVGRASPEEARSGGGEVVGGLVEGVSAGCPPQCCDT